MKQTEKPLKIPNPLHKTQTIQVNSQKWNCDECGSVAQLKPHKFGGVSPTLAQHHQKSWIKMGSGLWGCAHGKPNPLPLINFIDQQTVRFLLCKYRDVGTSDVSVWHEPGDQEHTPRDGNRNLSGTFPVGLPGWIWASALSTWGTLINQIFISSLEKPACSSWRNQGITGNQRLNKMFF